MSETPLPISSCRSVGEHSVPAVAPTNTASKHSSKRIVYQCKTIEEYDGSQGWCMVGLVFLTNFLVLGFYKSLGILTKILVKEFSGKMHVIGVLTGFGTGLTYPSGVILVGNYFVGTKRAGLANALIVSGSPVGGMIMPAVVSTLSEMYSTRGAFIIVGGLALHSILCVRAFTPPPKGIPRDGMDSEDDVQTSEDESKPKGVVDKVYDGSPPCIPEEIKEGDTIFEQEEGHVTTKDVSDEKAEVSHSTGIFKIYERDSDIACMNYMSGASIDVRYRPNASHGSPSMLPDLIGSRTKSVFLSGTGQKINATGSPIVPSELKAKESNVFLRQFGNVCDKCRDKSRLVASDGGLECYRKVQTFSWFTIRLYRWLTSLYTFIRSQLCYSLFQD
ncbi:unnamed protein product [Orchesella dallaii]|uniref:Uncharacterized protein n=1 Tax=Orchesella dallaii TaxID=48710 RepID=A0ABP1QJM1_9HEXA